MDGLLGLQVFDVTNLKHAFQYVYTRVALKHMIKSGMLSRERAQQYNIFLKVVVAVYTHTSDVQELPHSLHI